MQVQRIVPPQICLFSTLCATNMWIQHTVPPPPICRFSTLHHQQYAGPAHCAATDLPVWHTVSPLICGSSTPCHHQYAGPAHCAAINMHAWHSATNNMQVWLTVPSQDELSPSSGFRDKVSSTCLTHGWLVCRHSFWPKTQRTNET